MKDERTINQRMEFVRTGPLIYRLTFSTESPPPFRIQATVEAFYCVSPRNEPNANQDGA